MTKGGLVKNKNVYMKHEQIQYIEFLSEDLVRIKDFYTTCFGWEFTDWGPEYVSFTGGHVDGGFALGMPVQGSVLVIFIFKNIRRN